MIKDFKVVRSLFVFFLYTKSCICSNNDNKPSAKSVRSLVGKQCISSNV